MKWRNSKERELLASGGSREQTLPNKNNPHPDLSDADCDKPKIDLSEVSPNSSPVRCSSDMPRPTMDQNYEPVCLASKMQQNNSYGGDSDEYDDSDNGSDIEINVT